MILPRAAMAGNNGGRIWLLFLVVAAIWFVWPEPSVDVPPGDLVLTPPLQTNTNAAPFIFRGHTVSPLAEFDISARVLGKEIYRFDRESEVSPVDLALGWQAMSDSLVLDEIDISQGGRFYTWYTKTFPVSRAEIETQSANMHMIPSTDEIEGTLKGIPINAVIRIKGYLVRVTDETGWTWQSSMTRGDTGFAACELIWVKSLERIR